MLSIFESISIDSDFSRYGGMSFGKHEYQSDMDEGTIRREWNPFHLNVENEDSVERSNPDHADRASANSFQLEPLGALGVPKPLLPEGTNATRTSTMSFKYCGYQETLTLPANTTIEALCLKIQERLEIPSHRLKLISAGQRINAEASLGNTIEAYNGRLTLILGSKSGVISTMRQHEWYSQAAEVYNVGRKHALLFASARLHEEFDYQQELYREMPQIPSVVDKRRFGHLVLQPHRSCQEEVAALFGFDCEGSGYGAVLVPEIDCSCSPPIMTSVGCKRHIDHFLIGWVALIELRFQIWLHRLATAQRAVTDYKLHRELAQEYDLWETRALRFQQGWASSDLGVLYDELLDLERQLAFDPDHQAQSMLNAGPDREAVLNDMFSLQLAIQILKGDFDPDNSAEERTFTTLPFLQYERPRW